MKYRHEWKYQINMADYLVIRQRVKACMQSDPHAKEGHYAIRSLYFDNANDKALREKLDGFNRREKFRIRLYNLDTSVIHLEKKSKLNGLGTKFSAPLTAAEAQSIVDGELSWMKSCDRPLIQELYARMTGDGLIPKTIVDYDREPFIFAPGNVRVTFDRDIKTGILATDFLNPKTPMISAGHAPILMEVKWDEYLPDIIKDCVYTPGRRVGAFSKYAQCRVSVKFSSGN